MGLEDPGSGEDLLLGMGVGGEGAGPGDVAMAGGIQEVGGLVLAGETFFGDGNQQ
jgi:hypothetical protein